MSEATGVATRGMVWMDLGSRDRSAAKRFYSELFGWDPVEQPGDEMGGYTVFQLGGKAVGGLMDLGDNPAPVGWLPYIGVEDVRDSTERARSAGAQVMLEPMDVAALVSFSIISDPAGAPVGLLQPRATSGWEVHGEAPHSVCWQELHSTDTERAKRFYADVFGWVLETPPQFGGYTVCKAGSGDERAFAGIAPAGQAPMRNWLTYINVTDCDAAAGRVREIGGSLVVEPQDIPGIGRYAVLRDLEGGELGLLQPAPM